MKLLSSFVPFFLLAAAMATPHTAHAATLASQTVVLKPGWNSVYVEVLPANPDLSAIFTSTNIHSVWAYENNLLTPDFVQDVTEETLAKTGWVSWVPTNRVDSLQNDLFQVQVNRAYLVKNGGTTTNTITLSGRPSLQKPRWQPNSFNFIGLPIDPGFSPTFQNFFRASTAHYSATTGLQAMYRLNAAGAWQLAVASDLVKSGEAYWIYCKGNSDFLAPLTVTPDFGDSLNFRDTTDEITLTLQNLGGTPLNATNTDLSAPALVPISYAARSAVGDLTWSPLAMPFLRMIAGGTTRLESLAIRRAEMTSDLYETVFQMIDGAGTRLLLPVTAARAPGQGTVVARATSGKKTIARSQAPVDHAGLWVGTVRLSAVSEAHSGLLTTNISSGFTVVMETNAVTRAVTTNKVPNSVTRTNLSMATTPTGSEFRLRLLLHVDDAGRTRLLKEVIQMWKDGTTTNDAQGISHVDVPGRTILVTDESKIGQFKGITSKDGVLTGRRLSTAAFEFSENELLMGGNFSVGSTLVATNTTVAESARNPFKHRFHPDHQQGYDLQRVIELAISPPPTGAVPGYGDRVLEGSYRETVSGLHRAPIVASGAFRLTRMSTTATLNQ